MVSESKKNNTTVRSAKNVTLQRPWQNGKLVPSATESKPSRAPKSQASEAHCPRKRNLHVVENGGVKKRSKQHLGASKQQQSSPIRQQQPMSKRKPSTFTTFYDAFKPKPATKPQPRRQEAREPSGLQTPLSTSSWDLYSEEMPEKLAEAVSERLESWLGQQDSVYDIERRSKLYGEDIATAFPMGGTPGYARLLQQERREWEEES